MSSDLTTVAFIFKRDYSNKQAEEVAKRDHPLFARINREGNFTGVAHFYPIHYGNPQGVSGTLSSAISASATSKGKQLQMSRKSKYGVITLDGEAMAASRSDKGAFANLVYMETDAILEEMGDSFAFDLYRSGYGTRGKITDITGNVVTFEYADDARNFKDGMTVVGSNADITGASLRAGSALVSAIDEDLGKIELNTVAGITSLSVGDYLFRSGDPGTCMEGLAALTPLSAPTSGDSFRGISRYADIRRLAGVRVDDTGTFLEDNLGLLGVRISQLGKKAVEAYANPVNVFGISKRLGSKVEYDDGGGTANHGFQYIQIHTPAGSLKVIADPDCPMNRAYVVNPAKHYLKHLDGLPHIAMDDGLRSLRSTTADSIETRARGRVNYAQFDPGCFGVCSV